MYHSSGTVHDRDHLCFFYAPKITHTQTQTGEVTTKAMKSLEVYLVMLLVLWKVWSLKELINSVFLKCFIFGDWAHFVLQIIIIFPLMYWKICRLFGKINHTGLLLVLLFTSVTNFFKHMYMLNPTFRRFIYLVHLHSCL